MRSKLLLIVALLVALGSRSAHAGCPTINIVMFGDSITQGLGRDQYGNFFGGEEPGNGRDINVSYAPALRANIVESFGCNPNEVNIYNWGTGGDATWEILLKTRGVADWQKSRSKLGDLNFLMLMGGANDLYDRVAPNDVKRNLKVIIELYRERGLLPPSHIFLSSITQNDTFPEINSMYNGGISSLAAEQGVNFVDQYNIMQPWSVLHSGDRLHVSAVGYEVMGKGFFDSLSPVLQSYTPLKNSAAGSMVPIINFILND